MPPVSIGSVAHMQRPVRSIRAAGTAPIVGVVVALCTLVGCASDEGSAPLRVIVPNEVLADLVQRVACVEPVETSIDPDGDDGELPRPVFVMTLDEPTTTTLDDVLTISVPAVATTIDRPGPNDPWVWLDPNRFAEVGRAAAAALASSGNFDPALLDRCLDRIDAEMALLDEELFDATQALPDELRSIDVSAPGTLYFASRYVFLVDGSERSIRAGRIISTDTLDGAESYDAMMRANVERVVEILGSR
jgi:ABC-type Zn uptake system ZnuABC Zn-binding protein ZnuA